MCLAGVVCDIMVWTIPRKLGLMHTLSATQQRTVRLAAKFSSLI